MLGDLHISVAMCTYNGERFLPEQLASIAAQTRLPDELVVCDDGSQDRTLAMLEEFRASVPFTVRIVRNETNLGRTRNFEKSINLCQGEFIALTDFDDVWYPGKLQVLADALQAEPQAGYAFCNADLMDSSGKPLPKSLFDRTGMRLWRQEGFPKHGQIAKLLRANVATGAAMMMRSAVREIVMPISGRSVQDYWIATLASFCGHHGIAVFDRLMRYRVHSTQMTGVHPEPAGMMQHLQTAPVPWQEQLPMLEDLRQALHSQPDLMSQCDAADITLLDEKIAHVKARGRIHNSPPWTRLRMVASEIGRGGYRQFGLGWKSAVRDLVPFLD